MRNEMKSAVAKGGGGKRKLAIATGIVASFLVCFGVAQALQTFDDAIAVPSLQVGSQGAGGVTFFNGTIINNTTDSEGADQPVTFGDNVRIDGSLQRGNNSDTDAWPVKVDDDLMVYGDLSVTGSLSSSSWGSQSGVISIPAAGCHFTSTKATNMGNYISVEESHDYYVVIHCPVQLPNGAEITNFVANIGDSDGDEYISASLDMVDVSSASLTTSEMASVSSETAVSGYNQLSDTTISESIIDNDNYTYYGYVRFTGGGSLSELYFAGLKIEYTFTQPY